MAPLKRKHSQTKAVEASTPAPEATTRRATRQTSIAPLPIQPDPEPRKRRRRVGTNDEAEASDSTKPPPRSTQRTPPGMRGKENLPTMHMSNMEPVKHAAQQPTTKRRAPATAQTARPRPQNSEPRFQPPIVAAAFVPGEPPGDTKVKRPIVGTTKPTPTTTPKPQEHSPSAASPKNPKPAKPSSDRNIDKVVLGDICFRTWYPSYYGKEVLGDHPSSTASAHQPHPPNSHDSGSKDPSGAKAHPHKQRDPPPILDRLCVCPCCFKYSKELVTWWAHVRICETRNHIPGHKIYTHPKGSRKILVPAPGQGGVPKPVKGKRGSVSAKMVEEVVHDEGEWSIWEVDGEKDVSKLFCQNLSLFAKLFLDNKSVFFDVTGFNYFLLVYTPPSSNPPPATVSSDFFADFLTFPPSPSRSDSPAPRQHIVGFFSKEKMSWDNNNLACILVFPPWQRKGLGALLMGVSYEISRREGVMGGPEKPISDLGKKGYKRFWAGEVARWLLGLEVGEETVVDVERCSTDTWIAVEDCLVVLREMGVVVDAGMGVDPRRVREGAEGEEEVVEEVKEVHRVRVDKEAVRKWVVDNGISLERTCDPGGFVEGYAMKVDEVEEEG